MTSISSETVREFVTTHRIVSFAHSEIHVRLCYIWSDGALSPVISPPPALSASQYHPLCVFTEGLVREICTITHRSMLDSVKTSLWRRWCVHSCVCLLEMLENVKSLR